VERLRPIHTARALRVGTAYHAGLAALIRRLWSPMAAAPGEAALHEATTVGVQAAQGTLREQAQEILAQATLAAEAAEEVRAALGEDGLRVEWMLAHWAEVTRRADDLVLEPVAIERSFEIPVPRSDGRGGPLRLAGTIDAVWFDPRVGDLVLDEHKTVEHDPHGIERRAELDAQVAGYLLAARRLRDDGELRPLRGIELKQIRTAPLGRVRYQVMRRARPRTPTWNKDGRISSAAIDTTGAIYAAALDEQRARGIEVSEKQVERLRQLHEAGDRYFAQVEHWRSEEELERWRRELYVDAARLRAAERDPEQRTRNQGACATAWSPRCGWAEVCLDPASPEVRTSYRVTSEVDEGAGETAVEGLATASDAPHEEG
jgi:hypothetical protein